jgi:cystathionine beta-lyase/cystathionine gamma-synthase
MAKISQRLETKLVHAGEPKPRIHGAVSLPIFQSAMFEYAGEGSYHDIKYIRLNNTPNHLALHSKLAALENAEAAVVMASGMAAITTTLLSVLSAGDHLLAQGCLYGGTHDFLTTDLKDFGITYDFLEGDDPNDWQRQVRPNTKAIYVESMTNPLLQVTDLAAVPTFAQAHGLVSIIDNTFASPVNFRPAEWGYDVSLHSCTKYLNGHSDIVAGAAIGRADVITKITHKLNHFGGTLDPHACFLLHRGMKTLAVRVKHQNGSAFELAGFFAKHPAVTTVNYPGLPTHPDYQRSCELFDGFGGMLSIELAGGTAAAERFMHRTTLAVIAPSLGGPETLLTRPVTTSHAGMAPHDRQRLGITDGLIRISVGLEATDDLLEDFDQALQG